jgi:osmoprotectant transport system permease protein
LGTLKGSWEYIQANPDRFLDALSVHVRLSLYAFFAAIVISIPLGILASRSQRLGPAIVAGVAAVRVVPSIAVLFLLYPYRKEIGAFFPSLDRSFSLALVALTLLAIPSIVINTDAGLRSVDLPVLENARGLGMNAVQVFLRVQLPLALPVIVAGFRTAAVEVFASATLAAFVGAGSLGRFITSGLTLLDYRLLLVGAIPVTLLALTAEAVLAGFERLTKQGVR